MKDDPPGYSQSNCRFCFSLLPQAACTWHLFICVAFRGRCTPLFVDRDDRWMRLRAGSGFRRVVSPVTARLCLLAGFGAGLYLAVLNSAFPESQSKRKPDLWHIAWCCCWPYPLRPDPVHSEFPPGHCRRRRRHHGVLSAPFVLVLRRCSLYSINGSGDRHCFQSLNRGCHRCSQPWSRFRFTRMRAQWCP